jgi:hypothetical protein
MQWSMRSTTSSTNGLVLEVVGRIKGWWNNDSARLPDTTVNRTEPESCSLAERATSYAASRIASATTVKMDEVSGRHPNYTLTWGTTCKQLLTVLTHPHSHKPSKVDKSQSFTTGRYHAQHQISYTDRERCKWTLIGSSKHHSIASIAHLTIHSSRMLPSDTWLCIRTWWTGWCAAAIQTRFYSPNRVHNSEQDYFDKFNHVLKERFSCLNLGNSSPTSTCELATVGVWYALRHTQRIALWTMSKA